MVVFLSFRNFIVKTAKTGATSNLYLFFRSIQPIHRTLRGFCLLGFLVVVDLLVACGSR